MKIVVARKKRKNFICDRWEWKLFPEGDRYPEHSGDALTRNRAVKKAMNRIPLSATVVEQ